MTSRGRGDLQARSTSHILAQGDRRSSLLRAPSLEVFLGPPLPLLGKFANFGLFLRPVAANVPLPARSTRALARLVTLHHPTPPAGAMGLSATPASFFALEVIITEGHGVIDGLDPLPTLRGDPLAHFFGLIVIHDLLEISMLKKKICLTRKDSPKTSLSLSPSSSGSPTFPLDEP